MPLFFNRSSKNRAGLKKLESVYGKIRIPVSLMEVRWIGKYRAIAVLNDHFQAVLDFLQSSFMFSTKHEVIFLKESWISNSL